MYALFGNPIVTPSTPSRRHQFTSYPSTMFNPYSTTTSSHSFLDEDSPDEEEQFLIAALERKRQQKLARQQQLEKQRQQQLIEQDLALRRLAIAQAKYQAEQEALRQQ
ncbi:hypothetical protein BGZ65_006393, partial [Modicella reniformis]